MVLDCALDTAPVGAYLVLTLALWILLLKHV